MNQRRTNGVGEFILASFPVVFPDIYYIYIYEIVACSCADILHFNGEAFEVSRENHARPAKSALTKMSLAAGTSRTQPFVSILCEVPIRAVSRTALYNEGMRRKGENAARAEKEKRGRRDDEEERDSERERERERERVREDEAQGFLKIVLRPRVLSQTPRK